jgi:hypothetical protein
MEVVANQRIVVDADYRDVARHGEPELPADVKHDGGSVVIHGKDAAWPGERGDPWLEAHDQVVLVAEGPGVFERRATAPRRGEDTDEAFPAPAAPADAVAPADEGEVRAVGLRKFAVRELGNRRVVVLDGKDVRILHCSVVWIDVDKWEPPERLARRQKV